MMLDDMAVVFESPANAISYLRMAPGGGPAEETTMGAAQCDAEVDVTVQLTLYNVELTPGESGSFVAEDGRESRVFPQAVSGDAWQSPYAELRLLLAEGRCGTESQHFAVSGTWTVLNGNGIDRDCLIVEVRDAVFEPIDGQVYHFSRIYIETSILGPVICEPLVGGPCRSG